MKTKLNPGTKIIWTHMKSVSQNTSFPYKFLISLLISGIHVEEGTELGWLIGLVKHAIWADSLHFLYLMLLSISETPASVQPTLWPSSRHAGLLLIRTLCKIFPTLEELHG
jgi:hypothetical protein